MGINSHTLLLTPHKIDWENYSKPAHCSPPQHFMHTQRHMLLSMCTYMSTYAVSRDGCTLYSSRKTQSKFVICFVFPSGGIKIMEMYEEKYYTGTGIINFLSDLVIFPLLWLPRLSNTSLVNCVLDSRHSRGFCSPLTPGSCTFCVSFFTSHSCGGRDKNQTKKIFRSKNMSLHIFFSFAVFILVAWKESQCWLCKGDQEDKWVVRGEWPHGLRMSFGKFIAVVRNMTYSCFLQP